MIVFRNIYTGEQRQVDTEPHIAAFWGSSDRSPNVTQGQDRGWRLDPQVQVELENIMSNSAAQDEIARNARILTENMRESDVLLYISERNAREGVFEQSPEDFERKYQIDLNKVREEQAERNQKDNEFRTSKQLGGKPQSDSVKLEESKADEKQDSKKKE